MHLFYNIMMFPRQYLTLILMDVRIHGLSFFHLNILLIDICLVGHLHILWLSYCCSHRHVNLNVLLCVTQEIEIHRWMNIGMVREKLVNQD